MICHIDHHGTRCNCGAPTPSPAPTPAPAPAAEVIRCSCGKRATVTLTYLPRPLPLFGAAVIASVCPSCYPETLKRGSVLSQTAIPEGISG